MGPVQLEHRQTKDCNKVTCKSDRCLHAPPTDRYTWSCVRKCASDVITKDLCNSRACTPWGRGRADHMLSTCASALHAARHSIARFGKLHAALHSIARFGKLHAFEHSTCTQQHKHISNDPCLHFVGARVPAGFLEVHFLEGGGLQTETQLSL